jgi:YHS domain-containing protein
MNIRINEMKIALLAAAFAVQSLTAGVAWAQTGRNVAQYNLEQGLGLKGNDPVSVFPESGGLSVAGNSNFTLEHLGVIYRFANEANRQAFAANPLKYEPTYGGWCAYAMASGSKVEIDTRYFTISGNRAHYFVNSRAKRNFDADISGHEQRADNFWKQISGEEPRF